MAEDTSATRPVTATLRLCSGLAGLSALPSIVLTVFGELVFPMYGGYFNNFLLSEILSVPYLLLEDALTSTGESKRRQMRIPAAYHGSAFQRLGFSSFLFVTGEDTFLLATPQSLRQCSGSSRLPPS